MLFKSYILACIKLMINTCTVMVNLRLNVSLRCLATSKYNISLFFLFFLSFFFFTGSKAVLKNENMRKIETLKKNIYFKKIYFFKASDKLFSPKG